MICLVSTREGQKASEKEHTIVIHISTLSDEYAQATKSEISESLV